MTQRRDLVPLVQRQLTMMNNRADGRRQIQKSHRHIVQTTANPRHPRHADSIRRSIRELPSRTRSQNPAAPAPEYPDD